jgi:hypothetical protein
MARWISCLAEAPTRNSIRSRLISRSDFRRFEAVGMVFSVSCNVRHNAVHFN